MSRSARLLDLLQALRRRRRPVTGAALAEELGVSLRTLYRDIATLTAQGAAIEGSAGLGYMLRAETFLPPLMFTDAEADALLLGLRLVAARGDPGLAEAADSASAKVEAVLPPSLEGAAENGLHAGGVRRERPMLATLRAALAEERKLRLSYGDRKGRATQRIVWPIAIGFFEAAEVLAAWCELRQDYRHFRLDRIAEATKLDQRIPRHRRVLLAEWRVREDLDG